MMAFKGAWTDKRIYCAYCDEAKRGGIEDVGHGRFRSDDPRGICKECFKAASDLVPRGEDEGSIVEMQPCPNCRIEKSDGSSYSPGIVAENDAHGEGQIIQCPVCKGEGEIPKGEA